MAALSGITAVRPTVNTRQKTVTYGATVAAGKGVYLDTTTGKYALSGNANTTLAAVEGIAITPGVDTSSGYIATAGDIILVGATTAIGTTYFVGATVGDIVPEGDVASTKIVSRLGTAKDAAGLIQLSIEANIVAHA